MGGARFGCLPARSAAGAPAGAGGGGPGQGEPLLAARRDTTPAILLGKLFWYGAAVWLLRRADWHYRTAGFSMAALPALLMAGALYALQARSDPPTGARRGRQGTPV